MTSTPPAAPPAAPLLPLGLVTAAVLVRMVGLAALLALGTLGACAASTPTIVEAPELDGEQRILGGPKPLAYRLDLTIEPAAGRTSGRVEIDLGTQEPIEEIRLHAQDLELDEILLRSDGAEIRPESVRGGPGGALVLGFSEAVPIESTLVIAFRGALGEVPIGLYRVEVDGRWYAFTQFEPLEARRAFPCFDQPDHKTPWDVTMRVPEGSLALTNGPEAERLKPEAGLQAFRFTTTRPLPTYLIAFAVGELELAEAPKGALGEIPLRLAAVKGKSHLSGFTLETTPELLRSLEHYFGHPYPYQKLDLVAVPNFSAGAMENVGLITFREQLILLDRERAPRDDKLTGMSVNAHELAHMWFGNLVTLAWWDDLWLNEAFATWMATKVIADAHPEMESALDAIRGTMWVMGLDAKSNARAIRTPIRTGGDIYNAFDGITYVKGRAVLTMLEAWLGKQTFRRGVRAYMDDNAHGVATTTHLMEALERASGKPVTETVRVFLDQPGVPLLEGALECEPGQAAPAQLIVEQSRYRTLAGQAATANAPQAGEGAPGATPEPWTVPLCLRYGIGDKTFRECFLLDAASSRFTLGAGGCPEWLHPNADERGYYRWALEPERLAALAGIHHAQLTERERVALPGHVAALTEAGVLPVGAALDALTALAEDEKPIVVQQVRSALATIGGPTAERAEDPELRAAWRAAYASLLQPHLDRVGTERDEEESPRTTFLRGDLISAIAHATPGGPLRIAARALVGRFLADPAAVDPEEAERALTIAAWDGDETLWSAYVAALPRVQTPQLRVALIAALGSFSEPSLVQRSLGLILDGSLRSQDFRSLARRTGRTPEGASAAWAWLEQHYDALVAKLGEKSAPRLPMAGSSLCTPEDRARVEAFFTAEGRSPSGTARNLGLALEEIDRCITLQARLGPGLKAWLAARAQ